VLFLPIKTRPFTLRLMVSYLAISAGVLFFILRMAPHFSYTLDDPYIHLALAQGIMQGNYGINPAEITSPSSSVIWPFLLAPLSTSAIRAYVPLLLNVVFSLWTCLVVGRFVGPRLERAGFKGYESWIFAALTVVAGNLVGLTFVGMEHTLQLLCVCGCAFAVLEAAEDRAISTPLLLCAVLAPAVRYEDILYTLAVGGALWLQKRRAASISVTILSLLPLVALGLFLHHHGLAPFPNSVLSKAGVITARPHLLPGVPVLDHLIVLAVVSLIAYTIHPDHYPILMLAAALGTLLWTTRQKNPSNRFLVPALLASLLMILFGPYGWFFRYDVSLRFFLYLLVLGVLLKSASAVRWRLWGAAIVASWVYFAAIARTPFASQQIARQQYIMSTFIHDYAPVNVAVSDLGWVSFDAKGRFYVLDLIGLGSNETLRVKTKDAAWLDAVTRKHDIRLAVIYPTQFLGIPRTWTKLCVLRQSTQAMTGSASNTQVTFYAISASDVPELRGQLNRFASTLPHGVWLTPE
jgi:hypothetical protein